MSVTRQPAQRDDVLVSFWRNIGVRVPISGYRFGATDEPVPPPAPAERTEAHPYDEDRRVIYASCCLGATSVLLAVLYLLHVL